MKKTVFTITALSFIILGTSCKRCMTCSYNTEVQDPNTLNFYESITKSDEYCGNKDQINNFESEWNKLALSDSVSLDSTANCTVK